MITDKHVHYIRTHDMYNISLQCHPNAQLAVPKNNSDIYKI